jgi:hypothetical protein
MIGKSNANNVCDERGKQNGAESTCGRVRKQRENGGSAPSSPHSETQNRTTSQTDQITRSMGKPNGHEAIMLLESHGAVPKGTNGASCHNQYCGRARLMCIEAT